MLYLFPSYFVSLPLSILMIIILSFVIITLSEGVIISRVYYDRFYGYSRTTSPVVHEFAARDFHGQGDMQSSAARGLVDVGNVFWREGEIFKRGTWEEIRRFWQEKVVCCGSVLGEVEAGEGSSVNSKMVDPKGKFGNVSWPSWAVSGQKNVCVLQAMVCIVAVTGGLLALLVTMVFIKRWARSREMRKRSSESFGAMGEGAMRRYKLLSSSKGGMPVVEQGRVCRWEMDEEVGRGVCDGCGGGDGDWCGPRGRLEGKQG